jgi:hypothetical protein
VKVWTNGVDWFIAPDRAARDDRDERRNIQRDIATLGRQLDELTEIERRVRLELKKPAVSLDRLRDLVGLPPGGRLRDDEAEVRATLDRAEVSAAPVRLAVDVPVAPPAAPPAAEPEVDATVVRFSLLELHSEDE